MLCVAGTESLCELRGLRALRLDTEELDLRRHVGMTYRAGAYPSPLAQRLIAVLGERLA